MTFIRTDENGDIVGNDFGPDFYLTIHNYDLGIEYGQNEWLKLKIGPSFAIVSRL